MNQFFGVRIYTVLFVDLVRRLFLVIYNFFFTVCLLAIRIWVKTKKLISQIRVLDTLVKSDVFNVFC